MMPTDAVAARLRAEQYRAEVSRARETARELADAVRRRSEDDGSER
jgi:hypothetical protein